MEQRSNGSGGKGGECGEGGECGGDDGEEAAAAYNRSIDFLNCCLHHD